MMRLFTFIFLSFSIAFTAIGQSDDAEFAEYGTTLSISPFGPGLSLTYNVDTKNSISVAFGFSPELSAPAALLPDFESSSYSVNGTSSWMGVFWRHRPFENQNIGFNLGMASGQIENNLEDDADDHLTYSVNYTENPVMYLGVNYGSKPVKGLQFGIELGVLSTGGATVQYSGHEEEMEFHEEEIEAAIDDIKSKFAWSMLPNLQLSVSYGF